MYKVEFNSKMEFFSLVLTFDKKRNPGIKYPLFYVGVLNACF